MPVRRKTILLTVNGNALAAADADTGAAATDAGVQGENGAVWLKAAVPQEWSDLAVRLKVTASSGAYDESGEPSGGVIEMPLRQGVTVPGPLAVCLQGSDDTGVRRTADLRSLTVSEAAVPTNAVAEFLPLDFEQLKEEVETKVVHKVTGSGGALVTQNGAACNIDVSGTGGDMLKANYANGSGKDNPNRVDHALFAESSSSAVRADSAANAVNAANASPGSPLAVSQGNLKDCLFVSAAVTFTAAQTGAFVELTGGAPFTATLPSPSANSGKAFDFWCNTGDGINVTLVTPSGGFFGLGASFTSSQLIKHGQHLRMISDGYNWIITKNFGLYMLGACGYEWTPGGRLHQWGGFVSVPIGPNAFYQLDFNFPIPFPNSCYSVVGNAVPLAAWDWQKSAIMPSGNPKAGGHLAITNGATAQAFSVNWMADGS